ncbi:hypothetical protein D3C81_1734240 [compost metagenome]
MKFWLAISRLPPAPSVADGEFASITLSTVRLMVMTGLLSLQPPPQCCEQLRSTATDVNLWLSLNFSRSLTTSFAESLRSTLLCMLPETFLTLCAKVALVKPATVRLPRL